MSTAIRFGSSKRADRVAVSRFPRFLLAMPYLVDGHNLIGKMRTISLSDTDKELKLIRLLQAFCYRARKQLTVYFDRGRRSENRRSPDGDLLKVRFVLSPRTADQAIEDHLAKLAREARNWTVVSSDRQVIRSAESRGARAIKSEDFAKELSQETTGQDISEKPESLTSDEIQEWEHIFRRSRD